MIGSDSNLRDEHTPENREAEVEDAIAAQNFLARVQRDATRLLRTSDSSLDALRRDCGGSLKVRLLLATRCRPIEVA